MKIFPRLTRSNGRRTAVLVLAVSFIAVFSGCGPSDRIATWRDGGVTVKEFDRALLELPEAARTRPLDLTHEQWAENHLRAFALGQIVENTAREKAEDPSPEMQARRFWLEIGALIAVLDREILGAIEVPRASVDEATPVSKIDPVKLPLLNFSHIFVRIDRHGSDGARRRIAEAVAALDAGGEFADVARSYSDSAGAADGGLISNVKESDLESMVAAALAGLKEGETSGVIHSRTGLHIVRLERRILIEGGGRERSIEEVESGLRLEAFSSVREQLLEKLRSESTAETGAWPWRVGSLMVHAEMAVSLLDMVSQENVEDPELVLIDQLLLANEARRRGLQTEEFDRQLEQAILQERAAEVYRGAWEAFVEAVPEAVLRATYDAQPSRFSGPETVNVELIFVPQGRDAFATQRRMEREVGRLRSGEVDFAGLAAQISTGPGADRGGDLGPLKPYHWAQLSPELHTLISKAEPGEISDPIYLTDRVISPSPVRGGFAVVRVTDRHAAEEGRFEDVVDQVRAVYVQNNSSALQQEFQNLFLAQHDFKVLRIPAAAELGS